ncbi:MAG: hypothetical protein LBP54_03985 [Campylobacteraceae bacterium]|jgi:hypothetical protein|nr:hypothetical protein [Campylobacteraceae bacterium]
MKIGKLEIVTRARKSVFIEFGIETNFGIGDKYGSYVWDFQFEISFYKARGRFYITWLRRNI